MMTTEVMMGNDHLQPVAADATVREAETQGVLRLAHRLHEAETEVFRLKKRVAELEDLLSTK